MPQRNSRTPRGRAEQSGIDERLHIAQDVARMGEDRRTLILDAAVRVLEREGAAGFKQTRVAEEAGLEQGHLTYYFPKKNDLVQGAFDHFAARSREELVRALGEGTEPLSSKKLFRLVTAMAKDHRRTRVLLSLVLAGGPDPELTAKAATFVHNQRAMFATIVGRAPGDLDAELALAALRGIGVEQMLLAGKDTDVEARVERIAAWLESTRRDETQRDK